MQARIFYTHGNMIMALTFRFLQRYLVSIVIHFTGIWRETSGQVILQDSIWHGIKKKETHLESRNAHCPGSFQFVI